MPANNAEPLVLDTRGAARRLGVSASLLEKLRMTPERSPTFIRVGARKVVYRIADLDEWAARRAEGGGR